MAAVVAPQTQNATHEIMAPSLISPNAPRHGRSRHGGSMSKNNKNRGRGYSIFSEREILISKAVARILKSSEESGGVDEPHIATDLDKCVNCQEILAYPELSAIQATFDELIALTTVTKPKFIIKTNTTNTTFDPEEFVASNCFIRSVPSVPAPMTKDIAAASPILITLNSGDVPDLIVYETSYANYPLILASGGLKRAGGQAYLSFKPISLVQGTELPPVTADVSIYIHLPSALKNDKKIRWYRNETGAVLTEGDVDGKVSKDFWKSVFARRADIGLLFENGEVKKEIPIGLRGKGVKPKKGGKGRGKGSVEMRARGEDEDEEKDEGDEQGEMESSNDEKSNENLGVKIG